jgi:hypothetical protein
MKLRTFKTIGFASALGIVGAALPASASQVLRVKVPFSFTLAGQEFSAGQYRVDRSDNGLIIVQGEGRAVAVLSIPGDLAKPSDRSSLRFSKGETRAYLVGVQVEGEGTRSVPRTGYQERKMTVASR